GLELAPGRGFAFDLREPGGAMALQTAMQRRARQVRNGRLRSVEAVVERRQVSLCLRKATTTASSSTDKTVDLGFFGPVGSSATEVCAFPWARVFGLPP